VFYFIFGIKALEKFHQVAQFFTGFP